MDINDAEQEVIDDLDAAYAPWATSLTTREVAALRAYQSSEWACRLVNGVLRGTVATSTLDTYETGVVADVTAGLTSALRKAPPTSSVIVWRGLGNLNATFGATPDDAATLPGTERRLAGFASTTVVRSVAEAEFTDFATGALLRIQVPPEIEAAWLPPVGEADFADEYELLLEDDLIFRVKNLDRVGGILVLDCEVRQ